MRTFSRYSSRLLAAIAAGFVVIMSAIAVAHAAPRSVSGTLVDADLTQDTLWTKSASPYLLATTIHVTSGHTLTMDPGTIVSLAPSATGTLVYLFIDNGARLAIQGSPSDHVLMGGIAQLVIWGGEASIAYLDSTTAGPLLMDQSHVSIASSTFSHSRAAGLGLHNSAVDITGSRISDNDITGVYLQSDGPGHQPTILELHDSAIINNGRSAGDLPIPGGTAIYNSSPTGIVHADNDWWGSARGPMDGGFQPAFTGSVSYDPWLTYDPTVPPCCSSILFLPGVEASRLYGTTSGLIGGSAMTMHGWEPLSNADAKSLYLNPDGSSIGRSIYSGGPIDKAYGIVPVYDSFMRFLDGLSDKGSIGEWKAFGYDWRKPIAEVVAGSEKKATTSESLLQTLQEMALRSKTGKVTIIAHSNGGLVAKYLVKTLADMGKSDLVDKVISVAVPYLGTPQAIASLLHGDGQSIGKGLLMSKKTAQGLGVNMPSAYSLLPSAAYFPNIAGATIVYAKDVERPISAGSDQDAFIGSRTNAALMAAAETFHALIDPFQWPSAIRRWALVGWGNETTARIMYAGTSTEAHTYELSALGDGTVVTRSALFEAGTTTALDLSALSKQEHVGINHSNILEASTTKTVIGKLVGTASAPGYDATALEGELSQIPGVSIGIPAAAGEVKHMVLRTHSPVDLHVYDQQGRHVGFISTPPESGVEDDVVRFYENDIPGSSFDQNGGGDDVEDSDTNIVLSDEPGQTYSVVVQGKGVGEFTYEVERFHGDTSVSDTVYGGLPTTPLMTATTSVTSGVISLAPLSIDIDGTGSSDLVIQADTLLDSLKFFDAFRQTVITLLGPSDRIAKDLVRRIDRIEDAYKKDGGKRLDSSLNRFASTLGHKRYSALTPSDKNGIVAMISQFLMQFEK
jgi:pimeloyl-ACP methyl ester carboxylesterase